MKTCSRCGKEASTHIMSMFDATDICMPCKRLETTHPDYEKAREAEAEAVKNGNYNFPGIGLPADMSPNYIS